MNELINIQSRNISGEATPTVNARDLWAFLGSQRQFADWIKQRIEKYDLSEGVDFIIHKFVKVQIEGGREIQRPVIDYYLNINAAKEMAMVENNDKGRQVRRYFIECERKANQPVDPMQMLNDPAAMRGILLTYTEKVIALQDKIADDKPKVDFHNAVLGDGDCKTMQETAKILNTGGNRLFEFMRERGVLGRDNIPYQRYIDSGQFKQRYSTHTTADGRVHNRSRTLVTGSGVVFLFKLLQAA